MKKFFIFFLITLTSCAYQLEPHEKEFRTFHYNHVSSVLVVPFVDHTGTPGLSRETTEIFTEELARFSEIGIVHAATVYDFLERNQMEVSEANLLEAGLVLGHAFKVETVILGAVTEYQSYYPPLFGLSFELVHVGQRKMLYAVSETIDSNLNYARERLKQYAGHRKASDSVYGDEVILRKKDAFIRFVCNEIIRKHL